MKYHLSNIPWNPSNSINAEHATVPKDWEQGNCKSQRGAHTNQTQTHLHWIQKALCGKSAAISPTQGRTCFSIMFRRLEILYFSQSDLFDWKVFFHITALNIGCYIKKVTNQAAGERCHRVPVLEGHCLSLREPTSSALTSTNLAHKRVLQRTQKHKHTHTQVDTHMYAHPYPKQVCIHMQLHHIYCFCIHKHTVLMHANPPIHSRTGNQCERWLGSMAGFCWWGLGKRGKKWKLILMYLGQFHIHGHCLARPISSKSGGGN